MDETKTTQGLNRRSFLKISAIWAGGAWIVGFPTVNGRPTKVLNDEQANIMDALADAIIPPGEFAGGKDAGVTLFVDQQIGRYGYLQRDREMVQTCLIALNRGSVDDFGEPFIELSDVSKEEYLKKMETGGYNGVNAGSDWGAYTPSNFFSTVRNYCMMGFYGSPKHGGNKDYVSYRMLGLF